MAVPISFPTYKMVAPPQREKGENLSREDIDGQADAVLEYVVQHFTWTQTEIINVMEDGAEEGEYEEVTDVVEGVTWMWRITTVNLISAGWPHYYVKAFFDKYKEKIKEWNELYDPHYQPH